MSGGVEVKYIVVIVISYLIKAAFDRHVQRRQKEKIEWIFKGEVK
jgi:hypothetical protein